MGLKTWNIAHWLSSAFGQTGALASEAPQAAPAEIAEQPKTSSALDELKWIYTPVPPDTRDMLHRHLLGMDATPRGWALTRIRQARIDLDRAVTANDVDYARLRVLLTDEIRGLAALDRTDPYAVKNLVHELSLLSNAQIASNLLHYIDGNGLFRDTEDRAILLLRARSMDELAVSGRMLYEKSGDITLLAQAVDEAGRMSNEDHPEVRARAEAVQHAHLGVIVRETSRQWLDAHDAQGRPVYTLA